MTARGPAHETQTWLHDELPVTTPGLESKPLKTGAALCEFPGDFNNNVQKGKCPKWKRVMLKSCWLTWNASCEESESDSSCAPALGPGPGNGSGPCPVAAALAPVMPNESVVSLETVQVRG